MTWTKICGMNEMNKIKVSEASHTQLDWLVAKCEGHDVGFDDYGVMICRHQITDRFDPTTNAGWLWPIVDREGIGIKRIRPVEHYGRIYTHAVWEAETRRRNGIREQYQLGSTPLIAAARCYVASKMGEEVEVPEELV